jgi:hypothetical protein
MLLPVTGNARSYSDTALGDWYVNRIVVDRQPLLLLVSSTSLLPILVPAREVRSLPTRLAQIVKSRLVQLGVEGLAINAEISAMTPVGVGATIERSVLGIMVDFAKSVPYHLEPGEWSESTLQIVGERLSETPCHAARSFDRVIFPKRKAPELLRIKWLANTPLQPAAEKRGG